VPHDLDALRSGLGDADIYLIDQILRGRITERDTVLDAGCGFGRNVAMLLRARVNVLACDADGDAVAAVRALAAELAPSLAPESFRVEPVESMSFADGAATVVVSSAVLHFARDEAQFLAMVRSMWRCLAEGGLLFARMATSIGVEYVGATPLEGRMHRLGDGTKRFLADEAWLMQITSDLGGQLADPLKTTIVQGQRCMTTWVVRKGRAMERLEGTR
jgi:SAM-dependent methyltransferase